LRIAAYSHEYPPHPGGLEIVVQGLSVAQAKLGHDVVVTTTSCADKRGATRESGVEVHRVPALHGLERLDVPYAIPTGPGLRAALRASSLADVHHVHGALYLTSVLGARSAAVLNKPLILTEHVGFVRYESPLVNLVQRIAWRIVGDRVATRAAAIVACSERVRSWLVARYKRDVHLVRNAADRSVFCPSTTLQKAKARSHFGLPSEAVLGLFAARAAAKKNLEPLLRSLNPNFRLVCCGATGRQLPSHVFDLGVLPHTEMPLLYRAVDFMIHLGVEEGFPVVIPEAAASGLPIVLLWDEGYSRLIDRSCLYAIEDLGALPRALGAIAGSDELRQEIGRRAKTWSDENGGWEPVCREYLRIYDAATLRKA